MIERMCEYVGMRIADPQVWVIVVGHPTGWPASASSIWRRRFRRGPPGRGHRSPGEISDDLVQDMSDVLVSFCGRLYARRGARNRVLRALACAKRTPEAARVGGEDD